MKSVFLFTHSYPYGDLAESFLTAEIEVASILNIDLTIVPQCRNDYQRDIPLNIKLNTDLANTSKVTRFIVFAKMTLSHLFWKIPFQGKYSPHSIKDYFYAIKYLYGSFLIKHFIILNKKYFTKDVIVYSYWFTHASLGAILAKLDDPLLSNMQIITRGHGFDVYEEKVGFYFPHRELNLKNIDHIYTVSEQGKQFSSKKYSQFKAKFSVSRLGTLPIVFQENHGKENALSILSCSSVNSIKRVELIFNSILIYATQNQERSIKWTHIGSGPGFKGLQDIAKNNSLQNLKVELKGFVENVIVREILQTTKYDIFINLSLSEGIPVSIMEAISAGIPILATDAGGNKEIVNEQTGKLIPISFLQSEFNRALDFIISRNMELSASAISYYWDNFNAEKNYTDFYNSL